MLCAAVGRSLLLVVPRWPDQAGLLELCAGSILEHIAGLYVWEQIRSVGIAALAAAVGCPLQLLTSTAGYGSMVLSVLNHIPYLVATHTFHLPNSSHSMSPCFSPPAALVSPPTCCPMCLCSDAAVKLLHNCARCTHAAHHCYAAASDPTKGMCRAVLRKFD